MNPKVRGGSPFGDLLKSSREEKGWSQDTLAERTGFVRSKGFISQIEGNKYPQADGSPMQPGVDAVDAWAEALGVPKNKFRTAAGYPLLDTETSTDEATEEFTYAIAKYKTLSDRARELAKRHIVEILEFLSVVEQTAGKSRASESAKQGILDPSKTEEEDGRPIRIMPREEIPSIDFQRAKGARTKADKDAKNPPKVGTKGGRKVSK